jgi:hypothetical protein
MFRCRASLHAALARLIKIGDQFEVASLKHVKTFPCYILESDKIGNFTFHQRKPRIRKKRNKTGMPILYTIREEFIWIRKSGCIDQMGRLDHDHLGAGDAESR